MIIRPIAHRDYEVLRRIAVESGPGFTSLIDDRDFLERKIQRSIDSFARSVSQPGHESYLFVLEDEQGEVIGTTAIEASAGLDSPLYHYHRSRQVHHSRELDLYSHVDVLNMCNHYTGCSEICSLFLRPQFRRAHAGKLLSKVRFLFMAQHPERFADTVIAEMRGVSDDAGRSPFWDWLQRHFVDLDFATVSRLVGAGNKSFIAELMPKYPLYTHLLSDAAQQVIGQVHEKTRPALKLLEAEGFRHRGYVDLFDAGPTVEADLAQIRSIAASVECRIEPVASHQLPPVEGTPLIVANTRVDTFRAGLAERALYLPQQRRLQLPSQLVAALELDRGDSARFLQLPASPVRAVPDSHAVPRKQQQEFMYAS
ncbi:arginine N-succinyltransferase [Marinobacterium aestuariivivens]|uniref:Arginine N-succinyltransferase n=1 Tax=Marinobacterium aestuariivivens TaxID=1698799 RepID=A0ABW2A954_9GAMM